MLKLSIFVTLLISSSFTHGQTRSDFDKLNLSKTQLQAVYEKHFLFLTNKITGKQKLIKEESNAFIRLMNDTNKKDIGLNAFLNGSVIVSFYEPTLVNNEIKLNFSEYKLIPLDQIKTISYSIKHRGRTFWGSFILTITGFEMVFLPIVAPIINGNTKEIYSKPFFPIMIGSGIITYVVGRKLYKSLKFKDYNLRTDWEYQVLKK